MFAHWKSCVVILLENNKIKYPSIHLFSTVYLGPSCKGRHHRTSDFPLFRHILQLLWGDPKVFEGKLRQSPSSVSWVFSRASSQRDTPSILSPLQVGVKEALKATWISCSQCWGGVALFRTYPMIQRLSSYLWGCILPPCKRNTFQLLVSEVLSL